MRGIGIWRAAAYGGESFEPPGIFHHLQAAIATPHDPGSEVEAFGPGHSDVARSAPERAAFSVCQASVAHFTRIGNSRTPASAASLPSGSTSTGASEGDVMTA